MALPNNRNPVGIRRLRAHSKASFVATHVWLVNPDIVPTTREIQRRIVHLTQKYQWAVQLTEELRQQDQNESGEDARLLEGTFSRLVTQLENCNSKQVVCVCPCCKKAHTLQHCETFTSLYPATSAVTSLSVASFTADWSLASPPTASLHPASLPASSVPQLEQRNTSSKIGAASGMQSSVSSTDSTAQLTVSLPQNPAECSLTSAPYSLQNPAEYSSISAPYLRQNPAKCSNTFAPLLTQFPATQLAVPLLQLPAKRTNTFSPSLLKFLAPLPVLEVSARAVLPVGAPAAPVSALSAPVPVSTHDALVITRALPVPALSAAVSVPQIPLQDALPVTELAAPLSALSAPFPVFARDALASAHSPLVSMLYTPVSVSAHGALINAHTVPVPKFSAQDAQPVAAFMAPVLTFAAQFSAQAASISANAASVSALFALVPVPVCNGPITARTAPVSALHVPVPVTAVTLDASDTFSTPLHPGIISAFTSTVSGIRTSPPALISALTSPLEVPQEAPASAAATATLSAPRTPVSRAITAPVDASSNVVALSTQKATHLPYIVASDASTAPLRTPVRLASSAAVSLFASTVSSTSNSSPTLISAITAAPVTAPAMSALSAKSAAHPVPHSIVSTTVTTPQSESASLATLAPRTAPWSILSATFAQSYAPLAQITAHPPLLAAPDTFPTHLSSNNYSAPSTAIAAFANIASGIISAPVAAPAASASAAASVMHLEVNSIVSVLSECSHALLMPIAAANLSSESVVVSTSPSDLQVVVSKTSTLSSAPSVHSASHRHAPTRATFALDPAAPGSAPLTHPIIQPASHSSSVKTQAAFDAPPFAVSSVSTTLVLYMAFATSSDFTAQSATNCKKIHRQFLTHLFPRFLPVATSTTLRHTSHSSRIFSASAVSLTPTDELASEHSIAHPSCAFSALTNVPMLRSAPSTPSSALPALQYALLASAIVVASVSARAFALSPPASVCATLVPVAAAPASASVFKLVARVSAQVSITAPFASVPVSSASVAAQCASVPVPRSASAATSLALTKPALAASVFAASLAPSAPVSAPESATTAPVFASSSALITSVAAQYAPVLASTLLTSPSSTSSSAQAALVPAPMSATSNSSTSSDQTASYPFAAAAAVASAPPLSLPLLFSLKQSQLHRSTFSAHHQTRKEMPSAAAALGTTSYQHVLAHPAIFMPPIKQNKATLSPSTELSASAILAVLIMLATLLFAAFSAAPASVSTSDWTSTSLHVAPHLLSTAADSSASVLMAVLDQVVTLLSVAHSIRMAPVSPPDLATEGLYSISHSLFISPLFYGAKLFQSKKKRQRPFPRVRDAQFTASAPRSLHSRDQLDFKDFSEFSDAFSAAAAGCSREIRVFTERTLQLKRKKKTFFAMYTIDFIICAIFFSFIYLYYLFRNIYSYFERNGIPYVKPVPFFGNVAEWILMRKSLPVIHFELYKQLEPHRFGGVYLGWKRTILIRDVELVKNILVKDFGYFRDRGIKRDPHVDILSRNLFMMRGDDWKNLRIKLTSTFTSGKMKVMFPLVKECGGKLHSILEEMADKDEFLVKDACARFTTDVIGSCAFGLEINSLENPDSEFRKIGNRVLSPKSNYKSIIRHVFPFLTKLSKNLAVDTTIQNFFINLVRETIQYREQHKIVRGDFLDQLISLKNETNSQKTQDKQGQADLDKFLGQIGEKHANNNVEMTPELMTAQSFIFFVAGFETSSSTLSFMLLELAQHPHIQDKLRQEIRSVLENNDNQLTYEILKEMKYLDMVIAETLRKYPITGNLVRECTKGYKIPDSKIVLAEGTPIIISILGIHHDAKYYEKPYEFYPEHFTEEAQSKRPNYAYLPFGEGPRICIGERFAKMQIKVGVVNLLKDFSYTLSPKMKLPAEFTHGVTINDVKGGIRLRCQQI
ncbi:mucin-4-like [Planococcus citri]|uniref:mucin-4-like n=1 Tax=Planococcus citri TaxID=170843 RepID=UPI0031F85BE4